MNKLSCLIAAAVVLPLSIRAAHPHLLFSQEDLPQIKRRVSAGGVPQRAYRALLARCDRFIKTKTLSGKVKKGQLFDCRPDALSELALASLLSGDAGYAAALERLVSDARNKNLKLTQNGYDIPLTLDWGFHALSDENREYLKKLILAELAKNPKFKRMPYFGFGGNWGYFMYAPMALRYHAVLAEYPEFDRKQFEKVAEYLRLVMNHAVTPGGAPTEHGAYLNYPLEINGAAIVMAERKGIKLVSKSNYPQIPQWMFLETTAAKPVRFFPLEDCNLQMPGNFVVRLLLHLLPDDPVMNFMAAQFGVDNDPSPDPVSGIILYRPVKKAAAPAALCGGRFFPEMNLLLYRAGVDGNALQFASEAMCRRGHSHSSVGSFILAYKGAWRVIDPGYGVKDGLLHSIVTMDDTAPDAHGGHGAVDCVISGKSAAIMQIDAFDAWNSKSVYSLRNQAVPRVTFAERVLALLPGNGKLPPYLLVYDYLDGNGKNYQWRLQQDYFTQIKISGDQAAATHITAGLPPAGKGKEISVSVNKAGKYYIYALVGGKADIKTFVNGKILGGNWINTAQPWRFEWRQISSGKAVALAAGNCKIKLDCDGEVRIAGVALSELPPAAFGAPAAFPAVNSAALWQKPEVTTVKFLHPAAVKLSTRDVKAKKFFQSQRTLLAENSKGYFLTAIFPGALPQVAAKAQYGFSHTLRWRDHIDFIGHGTPLPRVASSPLLPRLKWVRIAAKNAGKFPAVLPDEIEYFSVGGGEFRAGRNLLFEAIDVFGDRQNIAYPRVGMTSGVLCEKDIAYVTLQIERRSHAFVRPVAVKMFAPKVTALFCNGKKTAFTRQGKYITFTALPAEPHIPAENAKKSKEKFFREFAI